GDDEDDVVENEISIATEESNIPNCELDVQVVIEFNSFVRTALVDASGVASLLTTTECIIVEAPGGMGGMGGMGAPNGKIHNVFTENIADSSIHIIVNQPS
ncbi:8795_t:CDS:2, partial [Entrophospora sp. SA101]